ncbi:MAG: alpha/beta fold hydrolase [Candidatus Marinimicrobia bacterium]|nr:alpha/beta fold hydrolase [Candidatus Neomarinimicrobiota bacterium]
MNEFYPAKYEPAVWLPNPHFQTIYASLLMFAPLPAYRREIIDLPDHDVIAADWLDGEEGQPLFILVHGMEGSSESNYARLLMNACHKLGWNGVVLHMRSCGGLLNRRRNFYHAGFYQDIEYFIDELLPRRGISDEQYLAGISLGGSQVAHYLAKGQARKHVKAAAMISTPLDLKASADYMQTGFNRLYVLKFRNSLLKKVQAKADIIGSQDLAGDLAAARSFWDLDNAATAPLHGFRDAAHYYQEMSAIKCLHDIAIPSLYLASRDDPFIPEESMPNGAAQSDMVQSVLTDQGGHVGFVDRSGKSWMVSTVFEYFLRFKIENGKWKMENRK